MNLPWILMTLAAIGGFAIFEGRAFAHPDRVNTLSFCIYSVGRRWPLSIFIMGMFAGGLAVHFFWHWCPPGSISTGALAAPPITLAKHQDRVKPSCYWAGVTKPAHRICLED